MRKFNSTDVENISFRIEAQFRKKWTHVNYLAHILKVLKNQRRASGNRIFFVVGGEQKGLGEGQGPFKILITAKIEFKNMGEILRF